ncbi:MAG: efflux RND transporter permease subunit [Deltaproteobacteria bacterium]|nr:efflux RND transporter permease subunit [Deltaproteobacteria bacterium]MBW2546378.1 efflux RND transporter permease subunit [Deltaproteobacteria bacterium]MBW2717478.1 efflux RND transporter permease subunit [Deltaproteobacteria bacterium]
MIERLIDFSIRNRALVILGVLLVGAVGLRAAQGLPIDAVPDVTNVQVQVLTTAPALGPLEVEKFITFPVETVMSGLPRLAEVRSLSKFGLSSVTIVFEEGTDIYFARQLVAERLAEARQAVPDGYGNPTMGPISTGLGEIYQFTVQGDPMCLPGEPDVEDCYTPMELRTVLDWYIAYQLRSVPGVVEVNTYGGELKTYEVQLDPARLTALDIPLGDVFEAIERNNANAGGAYIQRSGEQLLIRGEGLVSSLDDIRRIVVSNRHEGTPITIDEIAEVVNAPMVRQGAATYEGRGETVIGIAMMLMGANAREVSRDVGAKLEAIRPTLPDGVTVEVFYDRTDLVDRTIRTVATNLIEGGILVVVVLLLLLGNVRGGLVVASVIPLSMLGAFIAMRVAGLSGNLMSLGAIDFGLIVDGSVVIVENVVRVLNDRRPKGDGLRSTVREAAVEVGRPVAFAVAIIILVYVPVLSLRGVEGKMFQPMALTVVFALAVSLVLALTWVPALCTFVFRKGVVEHETAVLRRIRAWYAPLLERSLARPKKTLALVGGIFVLSLGAVPFMGAEFVPTLEEGAIAMHAIRLPSVSLEESVKATTRLERVLLDRFPDEIDTLVSKTGRPEVATDPMGVELSDVIIMLNPVSEWSAVSTKEELIGAIQETLHEEVPGQRFSFSQPIEMRMNELISGVRSDVAVSIYGEDLQALKTAGDDLVKILREVPGAADVKAEQSAGLPVLRIKINRDAIARYGIDASDVLDAVTTMGGRHVGEVFEGQRRFALQVRYREDARSSVEAIRQIPIAAPGGALIPLGQLADLSVEEGPAQISRDRIQRRLTVEANVRGRDLSGFVSEAKARIEEAAVLPAGYFLEWGGQFKNLQEATERLIVAVPVALLLIFFLLYMTYGSAMPALIVYLNVPFAATGGIFALLLRGMPFSISAGVGFIALFGIAVLNGVVLISYILQLQHDGTPLHDAVKRGALTRLRPVLMTAAVAAFGFLPMALATSAGAEVQRPLATVVIGGLVTSTLLTLLVLPTVYAWLGKKEA